ncbi:SAM-dependent methyltransferase [Maricaulis sp.]|uniref:class I SAM-dependent methyltransferase n=1 Tax=Maricaulis sp. TaxID=1486257 RepID=UPI002606F575|nr:SAM-dependent methyltransferase [Maricaulis sp.]
MIADRLKARIREQGPLSIANFMTEALFDPVEGFYATKDPIGAGSDFITAPEISQMFGELVGVFVLQSWVDLGRPGQVHLIELGPGRGTMMSDILRTARALPGFLEAAQVTLIEASAALKSVQAQTLGPSGAQIGWADRLEAVAPGPSIIIGNEFLDCLPVRQAIRHRGQWHERMVTLGDEGEFVFALGPDLGPDSALIPERLRDLPDGQLAEFRPGDLQVVEALAKRFAKAPGRALFIDYGPALSEPGDTLQAIRAHAKVEVLDAPGTADLTARVDFESLARAAHQQGLQSHGPIGQGDFLARLGLEARAATLSQSAPEKRAQIARQVFRLTDSDQMGDLFKAIALQSPALPEPPAFSAD